MLRRPWIVVLLGLALTSLAIVAPRTVQAADTVDPAEELYWAFHACDDGLQDTATPAQRVKALDDYRFRKGRAVRADASVTKIAKTREYAVKEWLHRCDTALPKVAAQSKKLAAREEAELALTQCKAVTDRASLEQAEADYRAFKGNKESALRHDPKVKARRELQDCDKRVSDWIAKRRRTDDALAKRAQKDDEAVLAAAAKEQIDSLGGTRDGAAAHLAVAIPSR